jgi:hypothetical protein
MKSATQQGNSMRYRTRLDFGSVLRFTAVLGLCGGIGSIPVLLLVGFDKLSQDPVFVLFFTVIGAPIGGLLNGLLYGLLGYLPYRWLTTRINVHTYTGEFVPVAEDRRET